MNEHKHSYYLPSGDFALYEWALNFMAAAQSPQAAAWGLDQAELSALNAGVTAYKPLLDKAYSESATRDDIRRKNAAHRDLAHHIQEFVNARVRYNKAISPEDMALLGGPVKDSVRTHIGAPDTRPVLAVRPLAFREHRLDFHDEGSDKRAIPYGMEGAVLYTLYTESGDPIPADPEVIVRDGGSEMMTHSPYVKVHATSVQGKRASYAAKWQNESGVEGGVSEPVSAIVP